MMKIQNKGRVRKKFIKLKRLKQYLFRENIDVDDITFMSGNANFFSFQS